jgi:nucleotide-binding universal stress UspA family protein
LQDEWIKDARTRLASSVTDEEKKTLSVVTTTVLGHPVMEILRYANDNGIHLIVMGTHGRGPLGHMVLGSVAERVVRKAPCPVLTVRTPEREFVE